MVLISFCSFLCSASVISTTQSSSLLICFSLSPNLLLIPSSLFFISVIVFFNYLWFFIFSNYLLKTYCNFLLYAWILFPGSWIIFVIITLNSLLGRLPVSMSLSCFYGVLSCSFVWNIILCHLLLSKVLFVFLCMWKVSYVTRYWRSGLL